MANCIILLGTQDLQTQYLNSFKTHNNIFEYNIVRFESRVKVSDIRLLKKNIVFKADNAAKKLFILSSDITTEAQNALLKTLEELPENVFVFLLSYSKDSFLPTVISRCTTVDITQKNNSYEKQKNNTIDVLIKRMCTDYSLSGSFQAAELFENLSNEELQNLIVSLRVTLIDSLMENAYTKQICTLHYFLKELQTAYPLLVTNNVNKRFYLENIFLKLRENVKYPIDKVFSLWFHRIRTNKSAHENSRIY